MTLQQGRRSADSATQTARGYLVGRAWERIRL